MNSTSPGPTLLEEGRLRGRRFDSTAVPLVLIRMGPLLILIVIAIVFAIMAPNFLSANNLNNILIQSSPVALLALGLLPVLLTRSIDLSVSAILALTGVVGAFFFRSNPDLGWLVIPLFLGVGALAGSLNSLLVVKFRIGNAFIVTLGTLYAFQSLAYVVSSGQTIVGMPESVLYVANGRFLGIPMPVLLVVIFAVLSLVLLKRTGWGRWMYAIGGNPEAAVRVGMPVNRVLMSTYVLAGVCAGAAAIIIAGRANAGSPGAGALSFLDAIAAVVIGGVSLMGGRGGVLGVLVGALILGTIANGLVLLSIDPNLVPLAKGAVLVFAVAADVIRTKVEERIRVHQARVEAGK